jgi:hypothetical protein
MPSESAKMTEAASDPEPSESEKASPGARPDTSPSSDEAPQQAAEQPRSKGGAGAFPYLIGGTGLAAIGAGTLLMVWGRKDNAALAQCSPSCQPSSVDRVRNLYTAADISFGVGLAAVGLSAYLFATSGSSEKAPPRAAYAVDVVPMPSGAFASVAGAF